MRERLCLVGYYSLVHVNNDKSLGHLSFANYKRRNNFVQGSGGVQLRRPLHELQGAPVRGRRRGVSQPVFRQLPRGEPRMLRQLSLPRIAASKSICLFEYLPCPLHPFF